MTIPRELLVEGLGEWCILHGYRGSIAHDMFIPSTDPNSIDDKDTMAVCIPPKDYYLGLKQYSNKGTKEIKQGEWDIVIYEFKKFIGLLANGNPNVLSLLWLRDNYYIKRTKAGQMILDNRDLFVCKNVFHSFSGYAYGQFKRMTHFKFEGYMGEKRKRLVEKHGYDCKNAAHLIRLLRMGIEFLLEGKLYVSREDKHELLSIKRGEWTLDKVKAESENLFKLCREAYVKSPLPNSIDKEKINELCVSILEEHFKS